MSLTWAQKRVCAAVEPSAITATFQVSITMVNVSHAIEKMKSNVNLKR